MPPFSLAPSASPISHVEMPQSSSGLLLTWCASLEPTPFSLSPQTGYDSFRARAHLALCACAILRREAADIIRVGWFAFRVAADPFNDSMTEIA
jgi:hypothetical protein